MNVPLICIALLGMLAMTAGFYVSIQRGKTRIGNGYPEDPTDALHKAARAHMNAMEYAPMLAIIIYLLGQYELASWELGLIIWITIARFLVYLGIAFVPTIAKPNPLRFIGSLSTFIIGPVLCAILLVKVI